MKTWNEMTDADKINQLYSWIAEIHSWVKPQFIKNLEYANQQNMMEKLNEPPIKQ